MIKLTPWPPFLREKELSYPLTGGWVGLTAGLDVSGKIFPSCRELNPDRPARS